MERITPEQSTKFVEYNSRFHDFELARYFTLTPQKEGWEKVTYYMPQSKEFFKNVDTPYDSWIYVLSNPSLREGILKIGYTSEDPNGRAFQISNSTGVALPFKVEYSYACFNGSKVEHQIHKQLAEYRINTQREFFNISLDKAIKTIEEIAEPYTK